MYPEESYYWRQFKGKCGRCGETIVVDDIDKRFDGCQDEWIVCENCKLHAFVKVRYNKICKVEYSEAEE